MHDPGAEAMSLDERTVLQTLRLRELVDRLLALGRGRARRAADAVGPARPADDG
jgi:hypothetical protein